MIFPRIEASFPKLPAELDHIRRILRPRSSRDAGENTSLPEQSRVLSSSAIAMAAEDSELLALAVEYGESESKWGLVLQEPEE